MLDENNKSTEDRPSNRSHLVKAKIANYVKEIEDSRKRKSQRSVAKRLADKNIYILKFKMPI